MAKIETKKIDDLLPDPNNINKHTQRGHGLVENSIRRRGVGRGILAAGKNTEKPIIMAGNLTHEKARDAGISEVVFVHTTGNQLVVNVRDDLDPTSPEAIALGIEDNAIGNLSYSMDVDALAAMAAADNSILAETRKQDKMFNDILEGIGVKSNKPVDAEPQIERAAELAEKWKTATGQLWKLGEHRLLIGDCTVRENVERLMGGERAQMIFTDPPYGVNYDGGAKKREKLENDNLGTEIYALSLPFYFDFTDEKASLYLWYADGYAAAAAAAAAAAGFEIVAQIIWAKNHAQFVTSAHYKGKHEPCYYGHKKNKSCYWYGENNEVTLWEYDRSSVNAYHPTQKPLELGQRAIKNSTKENDLVIDFFGGSGSTIIAAHNLNRRCYACEISEKYGAVILERFFEATGIQPELVTE